MGLLVPQDSLPESKNNLRVPPDQTSREGAKSKRIVGSLEMDK